MTGEARWAVTWTVVGPWGPSPAAADDPQGRWAVTTTVCGLLLGDWTGAGPPRAAHHVFLDSYLLYKKIN